jgi:hypothetical protein
MEKYLESINKKYKYNDWSLPSKKCEQIDNWGRLGS